MLNPFPDDKVLEMFKFKASADEKFNVAKLAEIVSGRVESNVEIVENAGYQHFLLFPHCFQKASFPRVVKTRDCLIKG